MTPTRELAEAVGVTFKALSRAVQAGYYSERLAYALESHLGLEVGQLPRKSKPGVQAPRLSESQTQQFLLRMIREWPDADTAFYSKLMGVHYEKGRTILTGKVRPSVLEVRAVARASQISFSELDDPSYKESSARTRMGELLRSSRLRKGMRLEDLAPLIKTSIPSLSQYENGRAHIPWERISVASQVLEEPQLLTTWEQCNGVDESYHSPQARKSQDSVRACS